MMRLQILIAAVLLSQAISETTFEEPRLLQGRELYATYKEWCELWAAPQWGFHWNGEWCEPPAVDEPVTETCDVEYSELKGDECVCNDGFVATMDSEDGSLLECGCIDNAEATNGECACKAGFVGSATGDNAACECPVTGAVANASGDGCVCPDALNSWFDANAKLAACVAPTPCIDNAGRDATGACVCKAAAGFVGRDATGAAVADGTEPNVCDCPDWFLRVFDEAGKHVACMNPCVGGANPKKENGTCECPAGTLWEAGACKCEVLHSVLKNGTCECPAKFKAEFGEDNGKFLRCEAV